jgi:RNA polymerase sigma factor (TIGR02999 family)
MNDLTRLLNTREEGDARSEEELILALYSELRGMARCRMAYESPGHTLQPTALVHEVWLRLVVPSRTKWQSRAQFFSAAGEAMRRILVDHARRKQSLKRGGSYDHETLDTAAILLAIPPDELLAVDEALDELAQEDRTVAELVKLRYYVGMSMAEAATAMGLAPRAAERLWTFGRAWLRKRLRQS